MNIQSSLPKTTTKQQKRVGRGYGSGVGGHTTGRGSKGDKVRGTTKITFDGTKIKKGWIKRTPFLRGKHRTLKLGTYAVFNLSRIDAMFKAGETVDTKALKFMSVKILGSGTLTKALNFKGLVYSESAKKAILAAGGKID
ncbi:MAG: uL15m family ribosomal protein [Microgenomates group bacterium]